MDLDNFNIKDLEKNLLESKVWTNFVNNFINELKDYLEKDKIGNKIDMNIENKYSNYWDYQNFIEDNVAANIGISRWSTDVTYNNELGRAVDESIMKLTEKEGTLYRKQFSANGSSNGQVYNVDKFENGKITHTIIPKDYILEEFENKDLIFQYKNNGSLTIRDDIKENVIKLASEKVKDLKIKENEKAKEFKKEGHIYEAFESDGYIFLNDLTEEKKYSLEDIDFIVDNYKGDGKYQVINGEYQKIDS